MVKGTGAHDGADFHRGVAAEIALTETPFAEGAPVVFSGGQFAPDLFRRGFEFGEARGLALGEPREGGAPRRGFGVADQGEFHLEFLEQGVAGNPIGVEFLPLLGVESVAGQPRAEHGVKRLG